MQIPDGVKYVAIGLMLFAAVAVDFVSKLLSIGFDLFFVSIAAYIGWQMLQAKDKKESK